MLEAQKVVESLLAKMKEQCAAGNFPRYELLSDELAVFAKAALIPSEPINWMDYKLSRTHRTMIEVLHRRLGYLVSKESLMNILYFDRINDPPAQKILDVFIHQLRRKIAASGFVIETQYGQGWVMRKATP